VKLLDRKNRLLPRPQQTKIYTDYVVDAVNKVLSKEFQCWIAAEAHKDDPDKHDQWVWKFANTNHMLEAIYTYDPRMTPEAIEDLCNNHRGMGWRFPQIYIFDQQPSSWHLDVLKKWKVPWGIESEVRGDTIEPPPNDDWKDSVRVRIEIMASAARTIQDIIDKV
jgi:hypothetical protein